MDSATYNRVLDESVLQFNGKPYAWTIPIALPIGDELAGRLKPGVAAALVDTAGRIVATLEISDIYPWDKPRYLRAVYLTERTDHPGGDMVLVGDAGKTHLLGGSVRVLPQPKHPRFGKYVLTPREVRTLLAAKGWQRVVAFQTRNPLHRAHEYALVYGLETLLRAGHDAAACLNPLIGETKGDDVDADVRMRSYEALIERRSLGCGDSDAALWRARGQSVPDRVILLGLDIKMFYGGPKEAVMHAIYRQNFGFTDIIIGRKHADAPYHDGKPIWGDFDAQKIFDRLAGDLRIEPLRVGFAAYYESWAGSISWKTTRTKSRCSSPARRFARRWSKAGRSIRGSCARARPRSCTRPWAEVAADGIPRRGTREEINRLRRCRWPGIAPVRDDRNRRNSRLPGDAAGIRSTAGTSVGTIRSSGTPSW